jgi:hypothetical protein
VIDSSQSSAMNGKNILIYSYSKFEQDIFGHLIPLSVGMYLYSVFSFLIDINCMLDIHN